MDVVICEWESWLQESIHTPFSTRGFISANPMWNGFAKQWGTEVPLPLSFSTRLHLLSLTTEDCTFIFSMGYIYPRVLLN